MRILITGGAGFVGSSLALSLRRGAPELRVVRLRQSASARQRARAPEAAPASRWSSFTATFAVPRTLRQPAPRPPDRVRGRAVGSCRVRRSPAYVVNTNLVGTFNCLEYARRTGPRVIFLSTSRVYSIAALRALPLSGRASGSPSRTGSQDTGWSERGISEDFPPTGARSLYGATKLSSELLIEEYRAMYGLKTIVNRCGVLTGPWQMGKVDQGFFVLWAARHLYGGPLGYTGFGARGSRSAMCCTSPISTSLSAGRSATFDRHCGKTYNVGGGHQLSVSLAELTEQCAAPHREAHRSNLRSRDARPPTFRSTSPTTRSEGSDRLVADAVGEHDPGRGAGMAAIEGRRLSRFSGSDRQRHREPVRL